MARAEQAVERAQLDLGFTKVTAPVSGRVSRYYVTVGNLVQAGDLTGGTLLTTIVSVDPMYAYFDVDEHTVLRVKQLIREGKAKTPDDVEIPVWLGLANEDGLPHRGTINFIDNQVNPRTGTLRVRGVFPNKDEALSPGYFARVRVPIGVPHKALLVTERALDTDQGQKVVYVVDERHRVASRPVRLGALHDGLREITDGLKPGERVIVNGLQQVRPGMTVEPNLVDMPTSKARKANATSLGEGRVRSPDPLTPRRHDSSATDLGRRISHAGPYLHQPPGPGVCALHRDPPARGHRGGPLARRRVPGGHAPDRPGDRLLPRGQRPGGGRHRGRARSSSRSTASRRCCT